MLTKHPLTWATGLALMLIATLSFWISLAEAVKFTLTVYFFIYLPGYFFLRNLFKSDSVLEQNALSVTVGIIMMASLTYAVKELRIIYNQATVIILAAGIIIGSLFWEWTKQRKNPSTAKRKLAPRTAKTAQQQ